MTSLFFPISCSFSFILFLFLSALAPKSFFSFDPTLKMVDPSWSLGRLPPLERLIVKDIVLTSLKGTFYLIHWEICSLIQKWKSLSCVRLFATPWLYSPWNSPGQNTGMCSLSLLQGSSQPRNWTQVSPYYRWILYQLSHKRSPRVLEWVAYLFSNGSSRPRNWTRVSCVAGGFFTNWAVREALTYSKGIY